LAKWGDCGENVSFDSSEVAGYGIPSWNVHPEYFCHSGFPITLPFVVLNTEIEANVLSSLLIKIKAVNHAKVTRE
jgi:hypothetical protein